MTIVKGRSNFPAKEAKLGCAKQRSAQVSESNSPNPSQGVWAWFDFKIFHHTLALVYTYKISRHLGKLRKVCRRH